MAYFVCQFQWIEDAQTFSEHHVSVSVKVVLGLTFHPMTYKSRLLLMVKIGLTQ